MLSVLLKHCWLKITTFRIILYLGGKGIDGALPSSSTDHQRALDPTALVARRRQKEMLSIRKRKETETGRAGWMVGWLLSLSRSSIDCVMSFVASPAHGLHNFIHKNPLTPTTALCGLLGLYQRVRVTTSLKGNIFCLPRMILPVSWAALLISFVVYLDCPRASRTSIERIRTRLQDRIDRNDV